MNDPDNASAAALSRRSMLQNLVLTAGGAALLATTLSGTHPAAAAKTSQKAVAYQDTPHGTQQCDNCRQFEAPASCKVVDGTVTPTGWCKVYVKKPAGA